MPNFFCYNLKQENVGTFPLCGWGSFTFVLYLSVLFCPPPTQKIVGSVESEEDKAQAREVAAGFLNNPQPEDIFGAPKAGPGMWASLLRLMNPLSSESLQVCRFAQNEAAHAVALCSFTNR